MGSDRPAASAPATDQSAELLRIADVAGVGAPVAVGSGGRTGCAVAAARLARCTGRWASAMMADHSSYVQVARAFLVAAENSVHFHRVGLRKNDLAAAAAGTVAVVHDAAASVEHAAPPCG